MCMNILDWTMVPLHWLENVGVNGNMWFYDTGKACKSRCQLRHTFGKLFFGTTHTWWHTYNTLIELWSLQVETETT